MARPKFVSHDAAPLSGPLFGFPYDRPAADMARALVRSLHGSSVLRRLRALGALVRSKRFRSRVPLRSFLPEWKRGNR
jgi:hypothetical protein